MNMMTYYFDGIFIAQHPAIIGPFKKIIDEFDRIVELGTYYGGLTLFLHKIKKPETELISFDIDPSIILVPKEYSIDFRYGNFFTEPSMTEIGNLISDPSKRVLLLCDGGYKEYEFGKFSSYLKPNDVVMVHDYAEDFNEWNKLIEPIGWETIPDSSYPAIENDIKKYDLTKYEFYDEFKKVFWGAFIKNIRFNGITMLQHPGIMNHFPKIIKDFDRIIELGTFSGGLALYLHTIKKPETELISLDIDTTRCEVPKEYGIDFRWTNYYTEPSMTEIAQLISEPNKRVLLLCDGGYKMYEFGKFSEYLKPGDVIMVHDYAETIEEFNKFTKAIGWRGPADSCYDGIRDSIIKYNLSFYELYNEFKSVLWGSFKK